jgi:hypothetical protein
VLPPSPREHPVRGLQLIRLLTQNRIAAFHTALEALPLSAEDVAADEYLSHPVRLERWLMEGSYAKVWNARDEAPTDEYEFFVDELMGTIRNEIASCEEAAYASLPLKDAATLLFFQNQSELLRFAEQVPPIGFPLHAQHALTDMPSGNGRSTSPAARSTLRRRTRSRRTSRRRSSSHSPSSTRASSSRSCSAPQFHTR